MTLYVKVKVIIDGSVAFKIYRTLIINNTSYLIFVTATEDKFELVYRKKIINNKDGVEITCIAEGLYPQPALNISVE